MASRQIVLDTETTGLNARLGDRVIEIGCIELLSRNVTDRSFHTYVDPQRDVDEGASRVHGLTREFLSDKPKFGDIAKQFVDYLQGAELIIHNADFDVEFLDQELALAGFRKLSEYSSKIIDTLAMARELHPGKRNSLDALCERYAVNNAHRTLHGALLDARLLAEVYLALTRGQESLVMELDAPSEAAVAAARIDAKKLTVLRASAEEAKAHEKVLDAIDQTAKEQGGSLWRRLTG
ncbi:MAG: DNA polymerase III subunit epsilon [Betaproteobacteria bacterium RBG_16_66_20]|nr:MAG: DNA polymerase III subunit epsilon [Betaproteobacteria bacterium RBG_16_66_20]